VRPLLAALALALPACTTAHSAPPMIPERACRAESASSLIGRPGGAALAEQARQMSGARTVRVLHPGDIVTMEFRGNRLNVHLDAAGKIERITCG
jgi:hypothetical protein